MSINLSQDRKRLAPICAATLIHEKLVVVNSYKRLLVSETFYLRHSVAKGRIGSVALVRRPGKLSFTVAGRPNGK